MDFEWDESKARVNFDRYGVDFVDAARVFLDPHRIERFDDRYEYSEERFQLLGAVDGRILFVVYTERGEIIRLISARRATRRERIAYEQAQANEAGPGQSEEG